MTEKLTPWRGVPSSDAATSATEQYLEAIARRLEVTELSNGEVVIVPSTILPSAIRQLAGDLTDVLSGEARQSALAATRACEGVQAVAFGRIDSIDLAIKVGLFYGGRIVFWDILSGLVRRLAAESLEGFGLLRFAEDRCDYVALLASNLMSLRDLARIGAFTMLPHPSDLDPRDSHFQDVQSFVGQAERGSLGVFFSSTYAGRVLAPTLAASMQLGLHPFSVDPDVTDLIGVPDTLPGGTALSLENRRVIEFLFNLCKHEFSFLGDASLGAFVEELRRRPSVPDKLRRSIGSLSGLTAQQWRHRADTVIAELREELDQDRATNPWVRRAAIGGPLLQAVPDPSGGLVKIGMAVVGPLLEAASVAAQPSVHCTTVVAFLRATEQRVDEQATVDWVAGNPDPLLRR